MPFLILALDGGGARVLLQWRILERILAEFPKLLTTVSVFAGTSAGSMLASALACGMAPFMDQLINVENVGQIFQHDTIHSITALGGLVHAKYKNDSLRLLLENHFGAYTIGEVPRALFITGFDTRGPATTTHDINSHSTQSCCCKRWHNVFFHNLADEPKSQEPLVQAIMKSAAAPYYFPMVEHTIDGGIAHNNPSLAVLTQMISLGVALDEVYILSLGSGEKPEELDVAPDSSLGLVQWLPRLINMIFDANEEATSHSCANILGTRFHRVNPMLTINAPLDSVAQIDELLRVADSFDLRPTFEWIRKIN